VTVLNILLGTLLAGVLVRQLVILAAVVRSARFLRRPPAHDAGRRPEASAATAPTFFVVLPVLREATGIADTITHFEALVHGHTAQLIIVTTARETAEAHHHQAEADTIAAVERVAGGSKIVHLHYPEADGLKGDQLNFAARYCADILLGDVSAERAFLVCYDADSRPPLDSLDHFAQAAAHACSDRAGVFHQSSSFDLRVPGGAARPGLAARLVRGVGQGAALRANRFVLGFEIPRLVNRSAAVGRLKRALCSYVYAHVTGHGLCIRLSLLLELPFPARSPLEDMHYSFYLGSRNLPMVAVPSLDRAEVPGSTRTQLHQAARWFFGPARFRTYLRDPTTHPGWRARLMAASAFGSALEWLGCALAPPATALVLAVGSGPVRWIAAAVAVTYGAQLLYTDLAIGASARWATRLARLVTCPVATTLFGVGGFIGLARLLRGGSGVGKTERR